MERFTRPLMEQYGVRLVIGKGGLRDDSLQAFSELGGAYLAIIGGAAALETTWVEAIEDVDLDDLHPGIAVEIPRARLRPAGGGDGQPRRQPVRAGEERFAGRAARRRSRVLA